jgi:hypothetical protein
MGFPVTFNWVLQTHAPTILETKARYAFEKEGNRFFPLNAPIDLIDKERNALAKIKVLRFQNTANKTQGEYEILKVYTGDEKRILSNYWMENQ